MKFNFKAGLITAVLAMALQFFITRVDSSSEIIKIFFIPALPLMYLFKTLFASQLSGGLESLGFAVMLGFAAMFLTYFLIGGYLFRK